MRPALERASHDSPLDVLHAMSHEPQRPLDVTLVETPPQHRVNGFAASGTVSSGLDLGAPHAPAAQTPGVLHGDLGSSQTVPSDLLVIGLHAPPAQTPGFLHGALVGSQTAPSGCPAQGPVCAPAAPACACPAPPPDGAPAAPPADPPA